MCMAIPKFSQKLPKFVLGDKLVVYKVFIDEGTNLKTPHREARYYIGELNKSRITKGRVVESMYRDSTYTGTVVERGLHAFVKLDDAIAEVELLNEKADREYRTPYRNVKYGSGNGKYSSSYFMLPPKPVYQVYECHVPKFARYYRGYWESHYPTLIDNIVASKLIVVGLANIPEKSNG